MSVSWHFDNLHRNGINVLYPRFIGLKRMFVMSFSEDMNHFLDATDNQAEGIKAWIYIIHARMHNALIRKHDNNNESHPPTPDCNKTIFLSNHFKFDRVSFLNPSPPSSDRHLSLLIEANSSDERTRVRLFNL